MRLKESTEEKALEHAKKEFPNESVGLVCLVKGKEEYFSCRNDSDEPEHHFVLSPFDYLRCANKGDIKAVVHSHPDGPPNLSEHDIKVCERGSTPWFVVDPVTEKWDHHKPFRCKD